MGKRGRRASSTARHEGAARLRAAVAPHTIDPGALGEYAAWLVRSPAAAARAFPAVATHLDGSGCSDCRADLAELIRFVQDEAAGGGAARGPTDQPPGRTAPRKRGPQ